MLGTYLDIQRRESLLHDFVTKECGVVEDFGRLSE
jgi:hypothetical protein